MDEAISRLIRLRKMRTSTRKRGIKLFHRKVKSIEKLEELKKRKRAKTAATTNATQSSNTVVN